MFEVHFIDFYLENKRKNRLFYCMFLLYLFRVFVFSLLIFILLYATMKDIRNKFSVFLQEDFAFFLSTLQSFFLNKKNQKYFLIIFVIYLVGYFALLRADIYYIDDIRRAVD